MSELSKAEIISIHDQMMEKFGKECKGVLPKNVDQKYGFNDNDYPDMPTLRRSILANEKVTTYLAEVNGTLQLHEQGYRGIEMKNALYQRYLDAKGGRADKFIVNDVHLGCWLRYLDLQSLEELALTKNFTEYAGHFYSYVEDKVLSCVVRLDLSNLPLVEAEMVNFHQFSSPLTYAGSGKIEHGYLYLTLTCQRKENWKDIFHLTAHVGDRQDLRFICALFLGTSTYSYPISGEIVLVAQELNSEKDAFLNTSRYLILKRARLRGKNFTKPEDLEVKGKEISDLEDMAENYCVFNFDRHGNLVISRFQMQKNYQATFYTHAYTRSENEQVCLLGESTAINRRLCISTHPKKGVGNIAYVILNIPNANAEINVGTFCSVGQNGKMPSAGHIVLKKTSTIIAPKSVSKSEIHTFREQNPEFKSAIDELVKIENSRRMPLPENLG